MELDSSLTHHSQLNLNCSNNDDPVTGGNTVLHDADDNNENVMLDVNKLIKKYESSLPSNIDVDDKLIVNLSKFILNGHNISVLNKGLTF